MSWFIFAITATLSWGFADLFYKKSADSEDRYSHLKTAVWVGLVMGISALGFLPFSETLKEGGISDFAMNAVKYLPASLGYIVSMVIGYAGLRYLELSIASPIQNASGAFSAIAMSLFFILASMIFMLNYVDAKKMAGKIGNWIGIFISFLLAFFSKESAITMLVAMPLMMYFFRNPKIKDFVSVFVISNNGAST